MKNRNYTGISLDVEKTVEEIQHSLMIKTLHKLGTDGTCLQIINTMYHKPTVSIQHLNEFRKIESISPYIWKKARMSTFTIISISLEGFRKSRQEK